MLAKTMYIWYAMGHLKTKRGETKYMTEQRETDFGQDQVVRMPQAGEMVVKLREAGLYGVTPQTDEFYDMFIRAVADNEKVGAGLCIAWELSLYDWMQQGMPPIMRGLVGMSFDKVIDAVTPDLEVATQAKEFMQRARDEARKRGNKINN